MKINFKFQISNFYSKQTGFTLIEVLVVASLLGIIGYMMSDIITRSLAGSQKTTVIGNSKQNGQVILEAISQVIRNSDTVVCLDNSWTATGGAGNMIVLYTQDGRYVRFRYIAGTPGSTNGYFVEDFPSPTFLLSGDPYASAVTVNSPRRLCNTDPTTGVAVTNETALSDVNSQSGVNINPPAGFTEVFNVSRSPGTNDTVTVQFGVGQAVQIGGGFESQLAKPTEFRETVQLR